MSFADYIAAHREIAALYKKQDEALAAAVMDELGYAIPARFTFTAENGDRWDINISARATLIERALPISES